MTHEAAFEDEQLELPFADLAAVVGGTTLTKVGAGTLTLGGSTANTYPTRVKEGAVLH